ncbi:MAG: DUF370 domain-containing protein [Clostridia bacterium]|nr:DUF370 domain-containing protein [Clostridia bacterium]
MYLHLSADETLKIENIIGVFDLDNTTVSKSTRKFLYDFNKNNIITIGNELPKSYILYLKNKKSNEITVYLTSNYTKSIIKNIKKGGVNNV